MSTRICPKCGNAVPAEALTCAQCGSITMRLGKSVERSISRTQALLAGIILLLFPLCCLLSVGYRVINGAPPDYAALFEREASETPEITATGTDELDIETPIPSDTIQSPGDPTQAASATLPVISSASCVPQHTERQVGEVIQVIDGDEIRVRIAQDEFTVRYIGITAPGIGDPFGPEASSQNINLVLLKTVTLVRDVSDRDAEGRLLRYVFVGNTFVNHELVRLGLASAGAMPPDLACSDALQNAQTSAQAENAGRWETNPEPSNTLQPLWTNTPDKVVCNCTGPDLNCGDFANKLEAQQCYLKCLANGHGDVYDLDPNDNGIACDE